MNVKIEPRYIHLIPMTSLAFVTYRFYSNITFIHVSAEEEEEEEK